MDRECTACGNTKPMECFKYTVGFGFNGKCKRCENQKSEKDRQAKRAARIKREEG